MSRDTLTGLGRRWVAVESWTAGPWVGLCRLAGIGTTPSSPTVGDDPPADSGRWSLDAPFVLGMALGAFALGLKRSAQALPLAALGLFLMVSGRALSRVRKPWADRTLMVLLVFALDRYYRILMMHCTRLTSTLDAAIHSIDLRLFGTWPVEIGQGVDPGRTEFFALVYGMFIPYLFSSLLLAALGRTRRAADAYLFGLTALYASAYTMYVLWPTWGPRCLGLYPAPLPRGPFLTALEASFQETQAYAGAFPSLHTGAVVYMLGADRVLCPRRFWIWLPWGITIVASTLVLRHHYLIDLIVGAILALGALAVMRRRWMESGGAGADRPQEDR